MIGWILAAIALALLTFMLVAPLESLRWWVRTGQDEVRKTFDEVPWDEEPLDSIESYVVYLSGVGTLAGDDISKREQAWLDNLQASLPQVRVIDDVFPYAVDNRGLLQRTTVWLWSWVDRVRRKPAIGVVGMLVNLRNIAQVLVSADPRYGPTQGIGLAQEIWRSLQRHGYVPGSGKPVYLIGYSGGGQMGLAAAWFLSSLDVPVSMISVGGIFSDDPGLDRIEHLYHLHGKNDRLYLIGDYFFPGRWPTAPLSPWGRAKKDGRVTQQVIGPMKHDGAKGYYGRRSLGPDGRSYAQITHDAVADILTR